MAALGGGSLAGKPVSVGRFEDDPLERVADAALPTARLGITQQRHYKSEHQDWELPHWPETAGAANLSVPGDLSQVTGLSEGNPRRHSPQLSRKLSPEHPGR
jgi:hypothetical protein